MTTGATKQAKTEYVKVKMTDGREIDFPSKRTMQREVLTNGSTVKVRFDYINGETRTFDVPEQHMLYSAGFGFGHKLGGSLAGTKENPLTVEDTIEQVDNLYARLSTTNDWNTTALGGDATGGHIVVQALMEATGKSKTETREYIDGILAKDAARVAGTEEKPLSRQALYKAFRANQRLIPIIRKLEDAQSAKRAPTVAVDHLLDDLATQ